MPLSNMMPWNWNMKTACEDPNCTLNTIRKRVNDVFNEALDMTQGVPEQMRGLFKGAPAADLLETESAYVLVIELPGVAMEAIDLSLSNDALILSATRTPPEGMTAIAGERRYGEIKRMIRLPGPVKEEEIEASLEMGVLTVTLPKPAEVQAKPIKIKSA